MEKTRHKHLHLFSVAAAMMLLSVMCNVQMDDQVVIGIVGSNVTLRFKFNSCYANDKSSFGIYYGTHNKMAQCQSCPNAFTIDTHSSCIATVDYHMTNLSVSDSKVYYAALYTGEAPAPESNRVHLLVMEDNRTTAAPLVPSSSPSSSPSSGAEVQGMSRGLYSAMLTGAVLGPLLLLTAVLLTVPLCLHRTKETNEQIQDSSIPTVHERIAPVVLCEKPGSSLVYSVLDFPQRPPQVLGLDSDTEYATVSYLPQDGSGP